MNNPQPELLGYANPTDTLPLYSERIARCWKWASLIPIVVGFGILVLFTFSGWPGFLSAGVYWLGIGGSIAFATFLVGFIMGLVIPSKNGVNDETRAQYKFTTLISVAAVPSAFFCVFAGLFVMRLWR